MYRRVAWYFVVSDARFHYGILWDFQPLSRLLVYVYVFSSRITMVPAMKKNITKLYYTVLFLYYFTDYSLNRHWLKPFIWAVSSEFGTYRLFEQRRFRRACASAQARQNLRYSLIQAVSQEEPLDRKPDPWPLWMAGHAQLKFVMTECSKTQIRLTGLIYLFFFFLLLLFNIHFWNHIKKQTYCTDSVTKDQTTIQKHMSRNTTKPTKWLCAQRRLTSA